MKVRTAMRPWEEIDVDEAEYTDLQRQGLLLPEPSKTDPAKTVKKES